MSAEVLAVIVALVGVLVTIVQWYFGARAAKRQRDVELVRWASEVIDLMAEIESTCFPYSGSTSNKSAAEALSVRSSALVDRGRLFFRNVVPRRSKDDDEGLRVRILDKVLQAHYVARHLAINGFGDGETLRRQLWQVRGQFIRLIQEEMGPSLKRQGEGSAGEHIPLNPLTWPPPTRSLRLPTSGS